jgi:hypothetical protein
MVTFTEGSRAAEAINYMVADYSVDPVTFSSGNNIASMQIVKGADTAVVPAVAADTTGLFLAYNNYNATAAAVKGVALKRHAVVNRNLIVYPSGSTTPQKAAHDAALLAVGIVVRS